ncbi:unnamed protein product, partial [Brenthis ino]
MFAKVLCFAAFVALATAQYGHGYGHGYSSQHISRHDGHPEIVQVHGGHGHGHGYGHVDYHTHPKYDFEYKVVDHHTGDIKSQHESRDGDVVKGYYALHQPDGSERAVHYHGDHHTGYCALLLLSHLRLLNMDTGMAMGMAMGTHRSTSLVTTDILKSCKYMADMVMTYPKYDFGYKVEDHHTGDIKSQHESRDGDVVKGYYALHQPDGSERAVHYHGDHHTGFCALLLLSHLRLPNMDMDMDMDMAMGTHRNTSLVTTVILQSSKYMADMAMTHPKYDFEYKVVDHHTGDIKSQHESRDGDVVKGYYALHQPDGSERAVHYHGDHHTGFHADVKFATHHLAPKHHY